jgi:FlaA1/EpsC-like NDP-sugar epimerase
MFAVFFFLGEKSLSRLFFGTFACIELFVIFIDRTVLKMALYIYSKNDVHKKNILIVGCGRLGKVYYEKIQKHNSIDINVIGFLNITGSGIVVDKKNVS